LIKASPVGLVLGGGTVLALARSSTRGDAQSFMHPRRETRNALPAAAPTGEVQASRPRIDAREAASPTPRT
jgi:hypothetical protein